MLKPLSVDASLRLRSWFEEAGYSEVNLLRYLGAAELPSRHLRNEARLLDRTREVTLLNTLLRWFWLGRPQADSAYTKTVPDALLALLLQSGLLKEEGKVLKATAMLLPVENFLVASDHPSSIEAGDSEMVLWPNPTSKFLARFAVRRHARATLDLGTGSGILSLGAAKHSDTVIATDVNPRVPSFVAFNARLNGVENIELRMGDGFAPVAGLRFDLILSNPPFFITPKSDYLFCDNQMELDQLCRLLVKEAPAHLNEGGYMQMLCEWAQVGDQSWEERIAEWLDGSGCDAWVMKGLTQYPEEYAQHRIREKKLPGAASPFSGLCVQIQPPEFRRQSLLADSQLKTDLGQGEKRGLASLHIGHARELTGSAKQCHGLLRAGPRQIRLHRYKLPGVPLATLQALLYL